MRILVTGATGLIGRRLCRILADERHEIIVLSRRPESSVIVPGWKAYGWDPETGPPSEVAWEGVEAVVHLAGEPVVGVRWTAEQKRRIRESRVAGTRNLIAGIERLSHRPNVLVSGSAVGFYGSRGDEVLTEAATGGSGFLSDVCRDWEGAAAKARELGLRVALVRIGIVLSPTGGALEKMVLPFKFGVGGRLGSGKQWVPWIHIDDIVGILRHALFTPAINGPINGAAPGITDNEEFTNELAAALHRPVFLPVPEFAMRVILGEMGEVVLASHRVVPALAQETGYEFRFPQLRPALESLLGRYRR